MLGFLKHWNNTCDPQYKMMDLEQEFELQSKNQSRLEKLNKKQVHAQSKSKAQAQAQVGGNLNKINKSVKKHSYKQEYIEAKRKYLEYKQQHNL
jgi:hypothetical protein